MPNDAPTSINVRRVGDDLATRRPAQYLLVLGERLARDGDAVIERFFDILRDPETSPSMFLKYLKELHKVLAVQDIMRNVLGLKGQGRPGAEDDPEVAERKKAWVEVLQRYPEEETVDAEFTAPAPPPRKRKSA